MSRGGRREGGHHCLGTLTFFFFFLQIKREEGHHCLGMFTIWFMLRWIPSLSFCAPRIMIQRRPLWLAVFFIYRDHILSYFSKMKRKSLQGHLFIDFYKEKSVSYCTCFFFFICRLQMLCTIMQVWPLAYFRSLGLRQNFLIFGSICCNKLKKVVCVQILEGNLTLTNCFLSTWRIFSVVWGFCDCREHDKKVCCLGLTSLLALPADQLPREALDRVFKATLDLLVAYKEQVAGFTLYSNSYLSSVIDADDK